MAPMQQKLPLGHRWHCHPPRGAERHLADDLRVYGSERALLPERRTNGQSALGPCVRDYYSLTEFLRLPSEALERSKSTVRILWSIVDTGAKPDAFSSVPAELRICMCVTRALG